MNQTRPNILLITTDQQRFDTISSRGNGFIDTPHLDWLCDEGITYSNAFADCPICMPSRATIMTGRSGSTLGLTGNSNTDFPLARRTTLPQLLGEAGYQTRAQGKMHFYPVRAHYGFQTMELPMDYYRERHRLSEGARSLPKEHGVGENEMQAVISTVHENESLTHWTVSRSVDFLETRDPTRPFFLWTSFTKPHPPFDPPANYWSLYANRGMPEPILGDWSRDPATMPQAVLRPTYVLNNIHRFSSEQIASARRAYYACITHIDYSLGLLFARMRELELLENTWIIFTSDHGENLGDHHMGGKSNFFEGSAHIPLIVRPPAGSWDEKPAAGSEVDTCVSLADVLPTICAVAGVDSSTAEPEGVDLRKLTDAPDPERVVVGESGDYLALISRKWKYHYFVRGGVEMLFDRETDPYEQHELLGTGDADTEVLASLRETMTNVLRERGSRQVEGATLRKEAPLPGPEAVTRWPGFHSTLVETDVLH
jgi:arylsulfatase A-like enzyme